LKGKAQQLVPLRDHDSDNQYDGHEANDEPFAQTNSPVGIYPLRAKGTLLEATGGC